tara:strand:- start:208 stop:702 length:495 start_codon:yes stop_codon:yes gene_type:complete
MNLEIERRFIVTGDEWKNFTQDSKELKQCYLINNEDSWTVRVRIINEKESWLTMKYPKSKISRYEFEYKIPINDALSIWKLSDFRIKKIRHELNIDNIIWVVDYFQENNFPLVLTEIELQSENEKIQIPSWCKEEVSDKKEFNNAALAKFPISSWPIGKRRLIL